MIRSVLMVCEGNVCRSPMAAALLGRALSPGVAVSSAGIAALDGRPADPIAIDLMRQCGIDLTGHIARTTNLQLMRESELVLAMSRGQQDALLSLYPFARGRVYRLRQGMDGDVIDPYRQTRDRFETCLGQVRDGVADWIGRLGPGR